jgi:DNA-binding MarR family transcriptional regulator
LVTYKKENKSNTKSVKKTKVSNILEDSQRLVESIELTQNAIEKATQKQLDSLNLDTSWVAIMFAIEALGEQATPIMISRYVMRKRHTVSYLLAKMEKLGLVKRARDLDRRNRIRASLTPMAHEMYNEYVKNQRPYFLARILSGLSSTDKNNLTDYLSQLKEKALSYLPIRKVKLPAFKIPGDDSTEFIKLFVDTVNAINQVHQKEWRRENQDLGIRKKAVLGAIQALEDIASPVNLARYLQRRCNSVTYMLGKMQSEGLIKIVSLPNTKYRYKAKLTIKGRRILEQSEKESAVTDIFSTLTHKKRRQLESYLQNIRVQSLKELEDSY